MSISQFWTLLQERSQRSAKDLIGNYCVACAHACESYVCSSCITEITRPEYCCKKCGIAMQIETQHQICGECLKSPPVYGALNYMANYEGWLADLVVRTKVSRSPHALGAILYLHKKYLAHFDVHTYADYSVLAMPIPKFRLAHRGFNLPLLMAKQISHAFCLPLLPSNVVKAPLYSVKKARLTKKERQKHRPHYHICNTLPQKVLIVDDVFTTGATVSWIATNLLCNGVESVAAWSFLRSQ